MNVGSKHIKYAQWDFFIFIARLKIREKYGKIFKRMTADRMVKYGRIPGKMGGLTGMDTGKTVPQFYTDYLVR